jgi:rare lipoprotein A (peptidoglycan hydrolase)
VFETYGEKVWEILARNGIEFDDNDLVVPEINGVIWQDANVEIVRVEYKEEIEIENIVFETILKKDDELSFLKKFTKQTGKNGKKELKYKVAYHNGKEVDRDLIDESVVKEPIDEIIIQGTQVKLGKKHTGACSWYAYTGTMSAAHKWLPKGSYVKVTNKANGKSVIVQINDRGPFVPGRIIDLDRVAFAKIASVGAGVIDVKMEEIIE